MRNNPEVRRQMFEMIEQWRTSGLTKKAYCQQQSIKHHCFYYWYKCYRQAHCDINGNDPMAIGSSFAKLQIDQPITAASVEIYFPGGVRMLFHDGVS